MTFPSIPTSAGGRILVTTNTAGGATKTFPDLSSLTKSAGDLLIAIAVTYDGNSTNAEFSSWGGGFTEFVDQATTATMGIGCAYKFSTGSESGTFTVTTADTSTNDSQLILLSISGAHASTPPEGGTIANDTTSVADTPSFNPTGWDVEDTLWIAVCGCGETSTTGSFTGIATANPTNFSALFETGISADVVGGVEAAVSFRQEAAASQDVAPWGTDVTQARNSALCLAVRPAGAADATVSPAAIARSFTVPQVAVSVGAAPAVTAQSFAVNQAAVSVGAAPAVIARSTVHPQVAVSVGVAPATIALAFTIPQALAGESSTVTPATIALAFSVPQVAVSVGAAPAVIARSFTMSQAAVSVGVAPAVIARAFALDQVAVSVGVAPAVIARAFTLPAVTADGGAVVQPPPRPPVMVTEEAVRRAQWVRREYPQPIVDLGPVVVVGDVEAAPNTIARSFTIPQVAVSVGVAPATIARSFTIPQATPSVPGDAIASPATIARSFAVNQVAVGVGVAPAVIARSITIPQAIPTVAVTVSAPLIARSFVMPAPAVSVGVAPAAVALAVVIPQATAGQLGDTSVALAVIALVFIFPEPGTETEFLKPWKLLGGGSPIRHPQKYGVGRTGWN